MYSHFLIFFIFLSFCLRITPLSFCGHFFPAVFYVLFGFCLFVCFSYVFIYSILFAFFSTISISFSGSPPLAPCVRHLVPHASRAGDALRRGTLRHGRRGKFSMFNYTNVCGIFPIMSVYSQYELIFIRAMVNIMLYTIPEPYHTGTIPYHKRHFTCEG